MSLWQQSQHIAEARALYGSTFPLEARHMLSSWIEAQPWQKIASSNDFNSALSLVQNLASELQQRQSQLSPNEDANFLPRLKLQEAYSSVSSMMRTPLDFVAMIASCLQQERNLVDNKAFDLALDSMDASSFDMHLKFEPTTQFEPRDDPKQTIDSISEVLFLSLLILSHVTHSAETVHFRRNCCQSPRQVCCQVSNSLPA